MSENVNEKLEEICLTRPNSNSNFRKMVFEELCLIETPPLYIDTPLNFPYYFTQKFKKQKEPHFFKNMTQSVCII
ncbi:hypothetical protein LG75P1_00005 [Lactococcus phage LG75P1]|nr:hypothetical protein LG75P1_00005 [Lactococcus phage LG75P1]WAX16729.1 hypothetical protein LG75P3_00005 [Lactococcus phage LG75P3]